MRKDAGLNGDLDRIPQLARVLAQGDDVVPIPGTKRVRYPEEGMRRVGV